MYGIDKGVVFGIFGLFSNGLVINVSWRCDSVKYFGWNFLDFDDKSWLVVVEVVSYGDMFWGIIFGIVLIVKWIWIVC